MENKKAKKQKGGKLLKILISVVVLAVVAVGGIIISDVFFPEDSSDIATDTVTVKISGTDIYLNGSEKINLAELDTYLTQRFEQKDCCTVALINDTQTPADIDTYNSVVALLGDFGIKQEPLALPATSVASIDEV